MKEEIRNEYIKYSHRDSPITFKLQVVQEVKRSEMNVSAAARKYGIQGSHTVVCWL